MHVMIIVDIYLVHLKAKLDMYSLHFNIDVLHHKHNTNACIDTHTLAHISACMSYFYDHLRETEPVNLSPLTPHSRQTCCLPLKQQCWKVQIKYRKIQALMLNRYLNPGGGIGSTAKNLINQPKFAYVSLLILQSL